MQSSLCAMLDFAETFLNCCYQWEKNPPKFQLVIIICVRDMHVQSLRKKTAGEKIGKNSKYEWSCEFASVFNIDIFENF